MKKISLIMMWVLSVMLLAACGSDKTVSETVSATSQSNETSADASANTSEASTEAISYGPYTIGVINGSFDDEAIMRQKYLEEFVAPLYNVKFVFSEVTNSAEAERTFIENLHASGGRAVMAFRAQDRIQMARLCNELGIYYTYNGIIEESDNFAGSDTFIGAFMNELENVAETYTKSIREFAEKDGDRGYLILSAMASNNHIQHRTVTKSILETLADIYDMTYTRDISELAVVSEPTIAENSAGIPITVYPGVPSTDNFLNGISSTLQTGNYDVVLATNNLFARIGVIVEENEAAIGRNIHVVSMANVSDALTTAFETTDAYGDSSLNACVVKPTSQIAGPMFAGLYNALTDHLDVIKPGGVPRTYYLLYWGCYSVADLEKINTYDQDNDTYTFDQPMLDSTLAVYNPDLTADVFADIISSGTLEQVITYMESK